MTEDQEFELFLSEIGHWTRPAIITTMGFCSALVMGAPLWRSLIVAVVVFVLMLGGLGRWSLEKLCLAATFAAMLWWMQIPAIVETVAAAHSFLAAR